MARTLTPEERQAILDELKAEGRYSRLWQNMCDHRPEQFDWIHTSTKEERLAANQRLFDALEAIPRPEPLPRWKWWLRYLKRILTGR